MKKYYFLSLILLLLLWSVGTFIYLPSTQKNLSKAARDLIQQKTNDGIFDNVVVSFSGQEATLTGAGPDVVRPPASASFSLGDADGYLPLEGLVDLQAEKARLQKEAEKLRGFISGHEKKLTNKSFVDRAPAEVVEEVRGTLAGLQKQLGSIEEAIQHL